MKKETLATPNNMAKIAKQENEVISARGLLSFCTICGAEYSACAGDYWDIPDDKPLECCDTPMILVKKQTRVVNA